VTAAKRLWLTVGTAALVLGAVDVVANATSDTQSIVWAIITPLVGWAFVLAGLVGWSRRPDNGTGRLLVAAGGTFLVFAALWAANNSLLYTIGNAFGALYLAVFLQLLISYPTGRLQAGLERRLVASLYGIAILANLLPTFFKQDPGCKKCPPNEFLVANERHVADVLTTVFSVVGILVFLGAFALLAYRWRRASPARRRVLTPVYLSGGTFVAMLGVGFGVGLVSTLAGDVFWIAALVAYIAMPFLFLHGMLRTRMARPGMRMLLETADEPTPSEAEASLRRALGDPSLRLAYWFDDRGAYVDTAGEAFELEREQVGRLTSKVEYEGRPLAAIEYDTSLQHEPELLEEVIAAARLSLEKDRGVQALRQAEARQRALLNAMPDLMIRTSRNGTYLDVQGNPDALARPPHELIGQTIWDVLPAETATPLMECVLRTLDTGAPQSIEYQLELDGLPRDFEARMVKSGDEEVLAVVREMTERRRLQDELRSRLAEIEREQEFTRGVVDTAPVIIVLVDSEGGIVRYNATCENIFGRPDDELARGRPYWEVFVEPEEWDRARGVLDQLAAGAPRAPEKLHWLTRDGRRLVISMQGTAILDGQGRSRFLICGLDVTERELHLEELRASRARLVEAGDAERRRLERNLHDGAQQRLVSLSLALRLAQAKLHVDPSDAELLLRGASDELALALEELRELARGIHPAILTDRGLAAALEAIALRAPLPVELETVPQDRLPGPVEAAAFYVVSESLTNVAKYAGASAVRISVRADNGNAIVEVADDGIGGADPADGSGLRGLADRIEALDGRLEVDSPEGGGTHVRAVIPL
jgi:PAS domain S-box-containing protein